MSDKQHIVTATMIVARVPGAQGGEAYFRKDRVLPSTITEGEIARLLELGVIAEVTDVTALLFEAERQRLEEEEAAKEAEFEARVKAAAAQMVADAAPQIEARVQAAAAKIADERAAEAAANSTPTSGAEAAAAGGGEEPPATPAEPSAAPAATTRSRAAK